MIDANRVEQIFMNCLSKDGVIVEGIMGRYGLNVIGYEAEITEMLDQLPDSFKRGGGGGDSFLNGCMTRDGDQWGEHRSMEQLFCLGIAIERCVWAFPRDLWADLPGGMPYVVLRLDSK